MAVVVSPDDADVAVTKFAPTFRPYGNETGVPVEVQAVLWHYDVRVEEVALLDDEGFSRLKDFRAANPLGDERQQFLFYSSLGEKIHKALFKERLVQAFVRLSMDDPFAAVVKPLAAEVLPKTAAKGSAKSTRFSSKTDASASTSGDPSAAGYASSSGNSTSKKRKASKRDTLIDYSETDSSIVDDENDDDVGASGGDTSGEGGAESVAAVASSSTSSKEVLSLPALFDVVKSEVNWVPVFNYDWKCFDCRFIDLFECQGIRCLRRELQAKCLLRIKIDDSGDYLDILSTLRRLKDAVRPSKRSNRVRRFARDMEGLLDGIYDRLEAHAMAERPGLAKMLYAEVSGRADIPSLKRIDKVCREYEAMGGKKGSRGGRVAVAVTAVTAATAAATDATIRGRMAVVPAMATSRTIATPRTRSRGPEIYHILSVMDVSCSGTIRISALTAKLTNSLQ